MSETEEITTSRAHLVAIERELARLQAEHDRAMSAFKFDEANALQHRIAAREAERRAVIAGLPALSGAPEPPSGIMPVLARPARWLRARRRR